MPAVSSVPEPFSHRLALREISGELIEIERILATVRVVLALSSLVAVYFDSTEPAQYASLVSGLLLLYLGHSIALLVMLQFLTQVSPRFSWVVHATDVLWPAVISLFTNGPNSPFFLYFTFALLAAAFRWGMRQALRTAVAVVATIVAETIALTYGSLAHLIGAQFNVNGFIMRTAYLVIFALLIGYLAESEKRRRAEALSIAQVAAKARVEAGLKGTLQATLQELLKLFGSREVLLVASEAGANRVNLSRIERLRKAEDAAFTWRRLDDSEVQKYLFVIPEKSVAAAWRSGNTTSTLLIDNDGTPVRGPKCHLAATFLADHPFGLLLMSTFSAAPDVSARVFLFEPSLGDHAETQLRFLQNLTSRVGPAVHNVYLLRRLRSRAAAVERARVARDLHDGVVQSLHAIGFRLYALRTGTTMDARERDRELLDLQQLVQTEASNIRTLIQHLKPLDVDPRHLADFLMVMIERYRYDTGIAAKFVCDVGDATLPPHTCREVAGIVQEALANVLKHSGAQHVVVRLDSQRGVWILTIEDDGRGFEFSGHLSPSELEQVRGGPLVIKERVRAIDGELSIESRPGQGARLEIKFPKSGQSSVA
jgi:signal transduction histidine kinase